jgi:hypothetical protein
VLAAAVDIRFPPLITFPPNLAGVGARDLFFQFENSNSVASLISIAVLSAQISLIADKIRVSSSAMSVARSVFFL